MKIHKKFKIAFFPGTISKIKIPLHFNEDKVREKSHTLHQQ